MLSFYLLLPLILRDSMDIFWNDFIYGQASWLFLLIFIGLGMVITSRIKWFGLPCFVACLFQAITYLQTTPQTPNTNYIWNIILLMVGMILFMMMLFGIIKRN